MSWNISMKKKKCDVRVFLSLFIENVVAKNMID